MEADKFDTLSTVLWSKSDRRDEKRFHLFIYHLLDSGAVALRLWDTALSESVREETACFLGLDQDEAGKLIAYWCALHDIGKASPVFQSMNPYLKEQAREAQFTFDGVLNPKIYHSLVSGRFLEESGRIPLQVHIAISGHHGAWNCDYEFGSDSYGGGLWQDYRLEAMERVAALLGPGEAARQLTFPEDEDSNLFTTWLSGFITTADWIASNEDLFPFKSGLQPLSDYFQETLKRAGEALQRLGWVGWKARGETVSFAEMFPKTPIPRPIQTRIFSHFEETGPEEPFVLIVEAPTGIGKTEIALYLADRWLQARAGSGLYVAMPTQATSNQIFDRTVEVLRDRYPEELVPIVLAHGQAAWSERVNAIRLADIGRESSQSVAAMDWFQNNRKRSLLSPFGVGTVDQAFLGILQNRHFFIRLFGLKNKVVIFDEVHAYDVHMQALFGRLLAWLRGLGTAVIVLSATLPEHFRRQIVQAYCGPDAEVRPDGSYPRLTLAVPGKPVVPVDLKAEIPADQDRELRLGWVSIPALAETLQNRLRLGGCAAVVCNTVVRAQELYQKLREARIVPEEELYLFHARFPQAWRQAREDQVLEKFGKGRDGRKNERGEDDNPKRPKKALVIATQVIEQSLDLDFDLLVSELAPVDLVLQRAGRLHRHRRERPEGLEQPELLLLEPESDAQGQPDFGRSGKVYHRSLLLKSLLALKPHAVLLTVQQTRALIEQVYAPGVLPELPPALAEKLRGWIAHENTQDMQIEAAARASLVAEPANEDLLYAQQADLRDEEDPLLHRHYRALTRHSDGLSLNLICLFRRGERLFLDPEYSQEVNWERLANDYSHLKAVLEMRLNLNRSDAVIELLDIDRLRLEQDIPALRYARILPFEGGRFETERLVFQLDRFLGLTISNKAKR